MAVRGVLVLALVVLALAAVSDARRRSSRRRGRGYGGWWNFPRSVSGPTACSLAAAGAIVDSDECGYDSNRAMVTCDFPAGGVKVTLETGMGPMDYVLTFCNNTVTEAQILDYLQTHRYATCTTDADCQTTGATCLLRGTINDTIPLRFCMLMKEPDIKDVLRQIGVSKSRGRGYYDSSSSEEVMGDDDMQMVP